MRFNPVVAHCCLIRGRYFGRIVPLALFAAIALLELPVGRTAIADDGDRTIPLLASTGTTSNLAEKAPRAPDLTAAQTRPGKTGRSLKPFQSDPIEETVLFINGTFVPPPLVVSSESDRVLVNGIEFPIDANAIQSLRDNGYLEIDSEETSGGFADEALLSEDIGERPRFRNRHRENNGEHPQRDRSNNGLPGKPRSEFRGSRRATDLSTPRIARAISNLLVSGRTVCVVFPEQPLATVFMTNGGLELLSALRTNGQDRDTVAFVLSRLPSAVDSDIWVDWIRGFQPTPEFDAVATQTIQFFDDVDARNTRDSAAVSRLRAMSYPMSIIGLVLSVFAFGHVVANKPPTRFTPVCDELTLESRLMVNRSLLLVVALSLLDLVWTILASQARQMTEMNPMGREFINDPAMLGAFKFLMTGLSVGLLFALKRHRIAQTASWWACMILTLLTMRWLTFNSMFT